MKTFAIALAILSLTACAKAPEKISAAMVPQNQFEALSCQELSQRKAVALQAVATETKAQSSARTTDTVGVLLLGVPMASVTGGDHEQKLAQAKGELIGVNDELAAKGCV